MNKFQSSLYRLSNLVVLRLNSENKLLEHSENLSGYIKPDQLKSENSVINHLFNNPSEISSAADEVRRLKEPRELNNILVAGLIQPVNISLIPDDNDEIVVIFPNSVNKDEENIDGALSLYAHTFNATAESLIIYDIETETVYDCNNAALELFGYERSEIVNLASKDISAEPDESLAILREAHKGYKVTIPKRILKKKDGSSFPAELYSSYFEENGKKLLCVAVRDISERHKQDEKIKEQEIHLTSLVNSTPDIVCIKDGDGKWLLANDADIALFDLQKIDFVGKTDTDLALMLPHFKEAFLTCVDSDEKAWEEGILSRGDETIIKSNGEKKVYDVIKIPIFNEDGSRKSLIVFGRDITRRKEVEDRLNSIAEQYKSLYENAVVGVYRSTVSGKPILANNAFLDILGFESFEEFESFNTIHFYKDKKARRQFIELAMKHDVIRGFETDLIKKDGTLISVRMNAHVLKNEYGDIEYFEGMVEDITEKIKSEQILIKAKEEAEKSDKLKSEFLAQMSHEIRTPINSLLNSVGLIREELLQKINDDIQSCFSIIDRSSHRIIRTIDSILNMSEIQTGTYDLQLTDLDLVEETLNPLMNEFRFLAETKGLKFNFTCEEEDTFLKADEYSVKQIFSNLIDNAIKFTNKGEINIRLFRNEHQSLNVEVQDTGIGISRDYLPELFKPFTQEQQGYTRKYEGNGLGLALVAKFCEFNRASITVDSEKGKGSLFRVNFNK